VLRRHWATQAQDRLLFGETYREQGLVFRHPEGTPLNPRWFLSHFQRLLKDAGLPHVRLHDLRHGFATALLELGENPRVVQHLLGHSRINVTLDIYSHVSLAVGARAVGKLSSALQRSLGYSGKIVVRLLSNGPVRLA
jgi:integrase